MTTKINKEYNSCDNIPKGLTTEEAKRRLSEDGANLLAASKKKSVVGIFLGQFKDIMIMILLAATVISVLLGEITDAVTIIAIVLLNAVLGFIQEYRTEKTLEALSRMTAPTSKCIRDGKTVVIPAEELVCGDVIELEQGDKAPADCAVLSCNGLFADESVLTGESVPTEKSVCADIKVNNDMGQRCVVYSGSVITKGNARCLVIATGMNSQMGKISGMLHDIDEGQTPLQRRLGELGKILAVICIVICVIVSVAGIIRGEPAFDMLLTGISIAIAAIPEGLPAAVTIALTLAVSRMMKQNALVNRLHSVETLGCASVICSDKTGTITENKMTVKKYYTNSNIYDVLGNGYKISGEIRLGNSSVNPKQDACLEKLLVSSVACNNASISTEEEISSRERGKLHGKGDWKTVGDPTEIALLVGAAKGAVTSKTIGVARLSEVPFDSDTRYMTVNVRENGKIVAYSKGAADVILKKCGYSLENGEEVPLTTHRTEQILSVQDSFSDEALRVLAFSYEENGRNVFIGLAGMSDPPREEAKRAIAVCKKAHIKTVMITGDHKNTAVAVAVQAGILSRRHGKNAVMTGAELSALSDGELSARIENVRVFARVTPADKLRIVRAFRAHGNIVAMTGDGVNDAPAVKEADIGVAMGISGTDVTKQAADVILLDDNFATLVGAVSEGRTIYSNIRKFVRYLLSCNIGEIVTMFLGIVMGMPLILLPTQILLVNLVTDGLPAIALGVEPAEADIMCEKPRSPDENFFSGGLLGRIFFRGIMIGLCTLASFTTILRMGGDIPAARTAALFTLVSSQLLHVFECKSERRNIFTVNYFSNIKLIFAVLASAAAIVAAMYLPLFQGIFSTVPLGTAELLAAFGFSAAMPVISAVAGVFFSDRKNR